MIKDQLIGKKWLRGIILTRKSSGYWIGGSLSLRLIMISTRRLPTTNWVGWIAWGQSHAQPERVRRENEPVSLMDRAYHGERILIKKQHPTRGVSPW